MQKETTEFINWVGDVAQQAVTKPTFTEFIDEAIAAPAGIGGFFQNVKNEASQTTVEEVEELFKAQEDKLVQAGVDPMAAATMVGGLRTAYTGYCWAVQSAKNPNLVSINKKP